MRVLSLHTEHAADFCFDLCQTNEAARARLASESKCLARSSKSVERFSWVFLAVLLAVMLVWYFRVMDLVPSNTWTFKRTCRYARAPA